MVNLFGEEDNFDHIPDVGKMIKREKKAQKPITWRIYRLISDEYYYIYCAKSHGHAKYLYCEEFGFDFMDCAIESTKVISKLDSYVRECDHGKAIMSTDAYQVNKDDVIYWIKALITEGAVFEYEEIEYKDASVAEKVFTLLEGFESEYTSINFSGLWTKD